MSISKRLLAECIGTFWLVFAGTGSAVIVAAYPDVGIGLLGVSLAFGLTLLTMAFTIGRISGCHINPARSTGPAVIAGGGWALGQLWYFWVFPIVGAVLAGIVYSALRED